MFNIPAYPARRWLWSGLIFATAVIFCSAGATTAVRTADDLDQDQYNAVEVGGDDCYDSLQSTFKTNATTCNPSGQPAFVMTGRSSPDHDIADHAWARDDVGLYHLYFQNEDTGSGDFIQHYTTPALGQPLTYVGPALQQTAGAWDNYALWAPHVVKNPADGLYYMFYTGVTPNGGPAAKQRIGVATSPDLTTWTKAPVNNCSGTTGDGCVYECQADWTQWGRGGDYDDQCRDPMVIRDQTNSRWLMFATALALASPVDSQVITVAQSPDLVNWTSAGYIRATRRLTQAEGGVGGQLYGWVAENPFVIEYGGEFFLFFTDSTDPQDYWNEPNPRTMVQYVSSSTLDVGSDGSANWTYRGYTPDPGVNAPEILVVDGDTWIVSHSIVLDPHSGYSGSHTRDLRLKRIIWNDDGTFSTSNLIDSTCRVPSGQINPGVPEVCGDGLDNDCANGPDDALTCGICLDNDGDGFGADGFLACPYQEWDCNDSNPNIRPGVAELCGDNIDNDCNGQTDEAGCLTVCFDGDEDGYGTGGFSACDYPEPDCNDQAWMVHPGAYEACDGVDNDCNGRIDEDSACPKRPRDDRWSVCDVFGENCHIL